MHLSASLRILHGLEDLPLNLGGQGSEVGGGSWGGALAGRGVVWSAELLEVGEGIPTRCSEQHPGKSVLLLLVDDASNAAEHRLEGPPARAALLVEQRPFQRGGPQRNMYEYGPYVPAKIILGPSAENRLKPT